MKRVADKKYTINLNQYRNWHPMVENKVKKQYTDDMADQMENLGDLGIVDVTYQVFKPTNRKLDRMNVISITSKYCLDALVHYGCLSDDNDDIVRNEYILPTQLDRTNPRVEVTIKQVAI